MDEAFRIVIPLPKAFGRGISSLVREIAIPKAFGTPRNDSLKRIAQFS
jgi:hypothetical protein